MKKMFMLGLMTVAAASLSADYYRGGYYQPDYYSSGTYYQPGYGTYYQPGYSNYGYYQPSYDSSYYQPYYQGGSYYQPQTYTQDGYYSQQGCPSGAGQYNQGQYNGGYNAYVQDMNHPAYRNEEDRKLHKTIVESFSNRYNNVQVYVDNGNVTLRGVVRSQDERRELEDKVRNMSGVRNLNSQVSVQGDQGGMMRPTDRTRGDYGNQGYSNRGDYRGDNNGNNGLDLFRGDNGRDRNQYNQDRSGSQYNQDRAGTNDAEIQRKLRDELSAYDNISAQVNNGEVTLRGSVDSQNDKDKVEKKVRAIRGVRNVNNQLTVRGTNGSSTNRGY